MRRLVLVAAFVLGAVASAWAGYQEGLAAYMRGDYARALSIFLPLARQGDAESQYTLAFMYASGLGVSKRPAAAAGWYRRAAEQGHVKAQINLGVLYQQGQGVERDYAQALRWYRRAADKGSAKGQYALGVMYRKGLGVPRDYVQAHMWYDLAAAQNLGIADEERTVLARKMTSRQVAKAEELADRWRQRHQTAKPAQ